LTDPPAPNGPWRAELLLSGLPGEDARRLFASLAPEEGRDVPRSEVHLSLNGDGSLRLRIEAPTTSALRATLNAHLRWIALGAEVGRWARGRSGPAPPGPPGAGSNSPAPSPVEEP
jgi:tRNA threonylcarbamoyladenosine modification (KEOPS) complex  Pcc1 subunit